MADDDVRMLAWQMEDGQQLRRALVGLVEACRFHHPDSKGLAAALVFADTALEDTSHAGWIRRMEQRRRAVLDERYIDCQRNGRHLEIRISSGERPMCTHCERLIGWTEPDSEGRQRLAPP